MAVTDDDNGGQDAGAAGLYALAALRTAADRAEAILDGQSAYGQGLGAAADDAAARALLKLVIGTDVQAYSAFLTALVGLPHTPNASLFLNADGVPDLATLTPFGRSILSAVNASALRQTAGLAIGTDVQGYDTDLKLIADAGTTAFGRALLLLADPAGARTALGAVSTADVTAAIAQVVGAAPSTLDTLAEIDAALNNDPNFASTVMTALAGKAALSHTHLVADLSDASANARSLLQAASYAAMRTLLGLAIGTNVQAWDSDLDAVATNGTSALGLTLLAIANAVQARRALGIEDTNGYLVGDGRNLTNLPVASPVYRAIGDANATLTATDRIVVTSAALTASRTWTLPLASAVPAGTRLTIADLVGGVSSAFPLVLARSGSDTLDGATSHNVVTPYAELALLSDGSGRWGFDIRGVGRGGTGATTAPQALTNLGALAKAGDTLAGALNFAPTASITAAATTDLGAVASNSVLVTGTTAITSLGTIASGVIRWARFASAGLVLTYNGTTLDLPTQANITTLAGDRAGFISLGGGNWTCFVYQRSDGSALLAAAADSGLSSTVGYLGQDVRALYLILSGQTGADRLNGVATIADSFNDQSDVASITGATYDATAKRYGPTPNGFSTVSAAAGAISSSDLSGNPKGNAFDGNTNTAWIPNVTSGNGVNISYIGQDFGSGNAPNIARILYTNFTDADRQPASVAVQFSDDNTNWTTATSFSPSQTAGSVTTVTLNVAAGHRYWRLLQTANLPNSGNYWQVAEATMQVATMTTSYTLRSVSFPAGTISNPTKARVLVQVDATSGAFTLNTDLVASASRNGASAFSTGTLALVQTLADGSIIYETGLIDLSGQSAGSSVVWQVQMLNTKNIVVTGVVLQWRP